MALEKPEHWTIRDTQVLTSVTTPLEYSSVVTFTSNIIGVSVNSLEAPETWNFGGWLERRINLPFGSNSTSVVDYRKLWLKQKQLIIFSAVVSNYKIAVRFPKWFSQASITIWEYQNADSEMPTLEAKIDLKLNQIDFQSIIDKLDSLPDIALP